MVSAVFVDCVLGGGYGKLGAVEGIENGFPLPASTVRYVGDGDSLCVGKTTDPNAWIEVRLADFNAPELHEDGGLKERSR